MKLLAAFLFSILLGLFFNTGNVLAAQSSVPILMYHYIGNNPNPKDLARNTLSVPPDRFDAQMAYLQKSGYTPISLDTLVALLNNKANVGGKPIVLTFDDGYIDFFYNAYPILRKYNFHAVSFLSTGLIGGSYYMNWNQVQEIQNSGLLTFEDHTISHVNLLSVGGARLMSELSESKRAIEAHTGYPVNFIAYPYGLSNGIVWEAARRAGFIGGLGTRYSKASSINMNMPRIRITGQMSLSDFANRI